MICPECGANMLVVGRVHRCVSRSFTPGACGGGVIGSPGGAGATLNESLGAPPVKEPVVTDAPKVRRGDDPPTRGAAPPAYRRYRNPEKRRAYMRELMRRRRAAARENAPVKSASF